MKANTWKSTALGLAVAVLIAMDPAANTTYDPLEYDLALEAALALDPDLATYATRNSTKDFAVGGGQHGAGGIPNCSNSDGTCVNEGFAAHSGPNGEDSLGRVSVVFNTPDPFELKGPVVCLDVHGNEAFILYIQEKAGVPAFPQGQHVLLHVIDNGNPVAGTPPDLIANLAPGGFSREVPGFPCGFTTFAVPLQKGNIVVHDAQ